VSGFRRRGEDWSFELTATKLRYWHRHMDCAGPRADLERAGFVIDDRGNWWVLTGPGIAEGTTGKVWEALSGRPSGPEGGYGDPWRRARPSDPEAK